MTRTSAPPSGDDTSATWPRPDVLVAGGDPLVLGRQVHPQLDAVEEPAAADERLGRALDVEDARAGGHPLGVAVGDEAAAAGRVLVLEGAVDHVGHGLEAAVRVPRRALGLARARSPPRPSGPCGRRGRAAARSTPAKARRTGNPSPSKPDGASVTDTTGRSGAVGAGAGRRAGTRCRRRSLPASGPPLVAAGRRPPGVASDHSTRPSNTSCARNIPPPGPAPNPTSVTRAPPVPCTPTLVLQGRVRRPHVTRQRGGATRRRGDQSEQLPSSPAEIGRMLREARESRGLDLSTVHDRLGRPVTQLDALESGDLDGAARSGRRRCPPSAGTPPSSTSTGTPWRSS